MGSQATCKGDHSRGVRPRANGATHGQRRSLMACCGAACTGAMTVTTRIGQLRNYGFFLQKDDSTPLNLRNFGIYPFV
ncbi:hypothetical protein B296_00029143 [Ensete ventricosum]|uniref:Uncharacterized protein n=1 Tax=Ensete ventricosum TaxID=4639 RepID=A0A427ALJ8_ENSVE|nr:hypothetical protein B296_00029143 [Ensete ventricosum]